ncbi:MAG TPA: amino acid adenylation domain-containing protein [Blastocatellia bacterium]|nr:amino acid adenylation domain-containing protein [Blastocatellia bacterium]
MSQTSKLTASLSPDEKRALLERLLRKKARESKPFPLSFAQERLWFLNQLEPGSPFYNVPVAVRMTGRLSIRALGQTFDEIVGRHEILRTHFPMVDGLPVQVISPAGQPALPLIDLSELPGPERDSEARRLVSEESQHGFDLTRGPMLRMSLLRLGGQEHVLILVMHHIISDGWSMGVLVREMAVLYEAFLRGEDSPLPELPIQYADYSVWQREWLQGEVLDRQLSYWKQKLGGAPPVLELPTDRPRPAIQTYRGESQSLELGHSLTASLRQLGRQEGVRLFMLMLAAFKVLLYRLSGQRDIAVGTPIAGRNRAEIEGLIGFFVNTLVMRSEIKGEHSFKEVMRREKEVVLEAFAHQDVPFEKLVLELQPARSLSYTPLFQVMFALQSEPQEVMNLRGLTLDSFEPDLGIAKFDLTLSVIDSQELSIALEYNTDLFDTTTITRMLGHFRNLLEGIVANPEQPVSTLPLLAEAERRKSLFDWNDTSVDYGPEGRIHELFEAQAERTPDATAVVFEQQRLTYAELNRRANQLARYLQEMGVGPESLVGICLERSIEMVVAILGILKAGGAYVPLDPDYPRERLAFIIEDARVSVLLTKRGVAPELARDGAKVVCLDNEWEEIAKQEAENPAGEVMSQNLAYVIYTSGSTGRPKGVMIEHHGICNRLQCGRQAHPMDESDGMLQATSFSFDVSVLEIFAPLVAGARLVVARPGGTGDPGYLVRLMAEQKVTVAHFVPSLLRVLLDEPGIDECRHLRQVVAGGEPLQGEIKDRFFARLDAELYNLYGPTEASVNATLRLCEPGGGQGIVPIGRPLANVRIYILDSYLQPAPIGIPGELHLAGVGLARGYLDRPDQTAEKFIPDPFGDEPGARMYKTGDVVRYLQDGNIEFISRVDGQVKVRGFRIELGEVESVINAHAGVRESVVVVREGKSDDKLLVAYIVPEQEPAPEASELRSYLRNRLPDYMVPSSFVTLHSLPLTPNGKVDRRALLALGQAVSGAGSEFVTPRDLIEFQVARIWAEVMGVDRVGVRDNFFESGGHSLLAVRLMARIRQCFGKELPLSALFKGATVEHLACILRQQAEPSTWSPLVAIQPGGPNPAFFCVHPVGGNVLCYVELARRLGPDQPFYAFQARGLSGEQTPCERVEEMASIYVEAMRTVQPEGPYFLGGWSAGGVVAYEMARQLESWGEQVALLALMDARAPGRQEDLMEEDDATVMASFGRHLGLPLERIDISFDHFRSLGPDERLAYVIEEARKADLMPADITLSQARRLFEVFKANLTAVSNYSPGRTVCRIALMKAGERISDGPQEPAMGWDELNENGVEVLEVPGNHFTMIHEPQVRSMAERLKSCIDETTVSERS